MSDENPDKMVALPTSAREMAKDPICGMTVDENKAAGTATYRGKTYYFCSAECRDKFQAG